jgi:hypothetical protein
MKSDIDIDLADRSKLLQHISHTTATMKKSSTVRRHQSGVYVTDVPYDPVNDTCSLDYLDAEERGYVKIDLLNIWLYNHVRDESHLVSLMREPDWSILNNQEIVSTMIHLSNHYETLQRMSEPVNSIPRLAMFLSVIRPGKKHLIGKTWREIAETIWIPDDTGYSYKKSHAVSYAHLVVVNMNLISENPELGKPIKFA